MSQVLMVISALAPGGPARQLALVAGALPPGAARVVVLGAATDWSDALTRDGVALDVLGWTRALDLRAALALRATARRPRPAVVHAWDIGAARALLMTGACPPGRLIISGALPPAGTPSAATRWLLRRCARVVAFGRAEAERYRGLGVAAAQLAVVPPGVPVPPDVPPADLPGLPPDARVVLCIGPIERHKGHREGVWAFDMVRPIDDRLHLVIVGTGGGEARVWRFVHGTGGEGHVHFAGPVADMTPWLRRAELVLVPSLREGGRYAALDAMAAGRPVVAFDLPGLAEVILPGETGLLVPPDDKLALARALRALLEDEPRRRRMGAAGRDHVRGRFPLSEMVRALLGVYGGAS